MEPFTILSSFATVGALLAALWQLRRTAKDARMRDEDRRVERALKMYENVVSEGATFEAFHRLSLLLRDVGSRNYKKTTWHVLSDKDLDTGGLLDPRQKKREQEYADLYAVLWFFERAAIALRRGLVSKDILMESVGFHFWWWGQILRNLQSPKASVSVRELASLARLWAIENNLYEEWRKRCLNDFNGGPSI